jgi:ribose 5-phosphate isomerase RpiB
MKSNLLFRHATLLAALMLIFGLVTSGHAQASGSFTLLDDAYATLAQADHDYKGHRVKAMKQIELAVQELGVKISGKGRGHEPQGTSDAQLRAAQVLLQQAAGGLSKKALKHANAAIEQLNIALSIK